jgi:small subunit ribosomal protein S17
MSDETKNEQVDEPQDQGQQDAGPVAEGDPPAHPPEDSPSTPPASDASETEAPATESSAPSEAAPASEPNPEDDLPWKQRRRLQRSREPHQAGPQLSTEERIEKRAKERKAKANLRRKQRAEAKGEKSSGTGTPVAERDANAAKIRQGIVVSDKGDKTITVRIDFARRHPTYEKIVRRSRTLHAHDERNEAGEGDTVRVVETRPLSKTKRWRLIEIMEKAK